MLAIGYKVFNGEEVIVVVNLWADWIYGGEGTLKKYYIKAD